MPAEPSDRPWYELTCREPALALPTLSGGHETPICIIGGGLAGLATALSLAERGAAASLLEAGKLGDGASGRNGGMVSAGFTRSSLSLQHAVGGELARSLHGWSQQAMALLRRRVRRHAITCDLVEGVVVASFFGDAAGLLEEAEFLNQHFNMRLEPRPAAWMQATYRSPAYSQGLFDPDGFHLDPLALTRGYARAARSLGSQLFEHSPVLAVEPRGSGWRVTTHEGRVDARHVVLCGNVGGNDLAHRLRRAILPIATHVIVTDPLGSRLEEVIGAPYAVYDDRFATGYYRPLADGRLLWGGRISLLAQKTRLVALMRRDLAKVYPQLRDVGIAAAWSGRMGFARHKMPILGELEPGLWVSTAYAGHGLNGTTMGGELIAGAILEGDRRIDAFKAFPPRPAFGIFGRLAAQGIYWGLAMRDSLRIRQSRYRRGRAGNLKGESRRPT
jgi:gamma-glutamylputrescine oxidase